jgi:hypothetical protein
VIGNNRVAVFIDYMAGEGYGYVLCAPGRSKAPWDTLRIIPRTTFELWEAASKAYAAAENQMEEYKDMAQSINCDTCGSEPGVMMVTNLQNGDTQAIGARCLPSWAHALFAQLGGQNVPDEVKQAERERGPEFPEPPGTPCPQCGVARDLTPGDDGPVVVADPACAECTAWVAAVQAAMAAAEAADPPPLPKRKRKPAANRNGASAAPSGPQGAGGAGPGGDGGGQAAAGALSAPQD